MTKLKRILLVDDDDNFNFISSTTFEMVDAANRIDTALNGKIACELLQENGCPELIVLDLNMPVMDGFQFLDKLEESWNSCNQESKVIIMTSSMMEEDRSRALQHEAVVGYFEKPLTPEMAKDILLRCFPAA